MNRKKYWAFISCSTTDSSIGRWLYKRLDKYNIPKIFHGEPLYNDNVLDKHIRPIFIKNDKKKNSKDSENILKNSYNLIVICSKKSAKCQSVNKDIELFKSIGRSENILALILDGEPNATSKGNPENECFPPSLRYPTDPIAGDLRKVGDGKERGFLKVLSGIVQLDFDHLYQRHKRRQKKRRLILISILFSIILIINIYFSVVFFSSIDFVTKSRKFDQVDIKSLELEWNIYSRELMESSDRILILQKTVDLISKDSISKERNLTIEQALLISYLYDKEIEKLTNEELRTKSDETEKSLMEGTANE